VRQMFPTVENAEAETIAGGGNRPVHLVQCRLTQNQSLVRQSILQMKHPEAHQVVRAGIDRRRPDMIEGEERQRTSPLVVAFSDEVLQSNRQIDRGVSEAQGNEYLLAHELRI